MSELKPYSNQFEDIHVKVKADIQAGDSYRPIQGVVDINNVEPIGLEHNYGEVLVISFWALWCPSQASMDLNQKILTKKSEEWDGKARFISICIDNTQKAVASMIKIKGWDKSQHCLKHQSECTKLYSVSGVPHLMIIDTSGKIAFKGNPINRPDLEADVTDLI